MAKNAKFALVLFDWDGCTLILPTRKMKTGKAKLLQPGMTLDIHFEGRQHKTEILEVSDSLEYLNDFEDEWSMSPRSLALDKEKAARDEADSQLAYGGFLNICGDVDNYTPSTPIQATSSSEILKEHTSTTSEKALELSQRPDAEVNQKEASTSTKFPLDKQGTNGRKITLLYQGSGEYSKRTTNPKKRPLHKGSLSDEQIDMVKNMVQMSASNKVNKGSQTDSVVVVDANTDLRQLMKRPKHDVSVQCNDIEDRLGALEKFVESADKKLTEIGTAVLKLCQSLTDISSMEISIPDENTHLTPPDAPKVTSTPELRTNNYMELTNPSSPEMSPESDPASSQSDLNMQTGVCDIILPKTDPTTDVYFQQEMEHFSTQSASSTEFTQQGNLVLDCHQQSTVDFSFLKNQAIINNSCPGAVIEIHNANDMECITDNTEVRIHPSVVRSIQARTSTVTNFAWTLAQAIFQESEMEGRNYRGNKGKAPLSPRRVQAIEHCIADKFGQDPDYIKLAISAINTGIRNKKTNREYRQKMYAKKLPFTVLDLNQM